MSDNSQYELLKKYNILIYLKFLGFSFLGIFLFFIPINIGGVHSIPLDHIISYINKIAPILGTILAVIFITIGGIIPWVNKSFKVDRLSLILAVFRLLGVPLVYMAVFNWGPNWLLREDILPAVFKNITVSVALIVPLGALGLTFILGYGFLEFIGVLVKPIMRPLYKVPGKAAVNAVASFIGSFSVGMLLTNQLYNDSKYTYKEAAIIMTGFSTASAAFMIVIAKTAQLMDMWNFYFWSTLIITFVVTALIIRMWPITKIDDSFADNVGKPEVDTHGNVFKRAISEGLTIAAEADPIFKNLWVNLKAGIRMLYVLLPTGISVATIAFILVKMTPVFDIIGYIFLPVTYLLSFFGLPVPMMIAKNCAVALGEMFVPNTLAISLPIAARYVIAVVSISEIIFFGGYLPCLYSTKIKLKISNVLVIWFERTLLSIFLAGIVAILYF